jgi:hypothetical protein
MAIADRSIPTGETMKVLKQFCAVTVLTIMLAQVAPAEEGVIHPGVIPPPPPPTTNGVIHPGLTAPGEEINTENEIIDLVTEMTLNFVQNLIALF